MPSSGSDRRFAEAMRAYEAERGPMMASSAPPPTGSLGRYVLGAAIGEGATAVVYRARDAELGRDVAVKILREPLGVQSGTRERFEREARIVAGLSHPNVVTVFDTGEVGGRPYLVMELVTGRSMAAMIARGGLEWREAVRLVGGAARGIASAHARGIVHRDLKPANILVTGAGEPKVADFGLAQMAGSDGAITRTGSVLGTPLYMAPEQVLGKTREIDARTDVHALGAILYQALTGRPPHPGESVTEIYARIVSEDPVAPRRLVPGLPPALEVVAMKALERDPAARYATAEAFAEDLRRVLAGEPVLARPPGAAVRAARWIRRHSAWSAGAAALVLASIAWGAVAVEQGRRAAEAQRHLEQGHFELDKALLMLYAPGADADEFLRRIAKARGSVEKAVALTPNAVAAQYLLGRAWSLEGRERKAEECWRRVVELDPSFGPARFELGRLLLVRSYLAALSRLRDASQAEAGPAERLSAEAAREIEAAEKLGGIDDGLPRELASIMLVYARRDYPAVRQRALKAIETFRGAPGAEELHWLAGLATPSPPERIALFDAALRIRPLHPVLLFSRGNVRRIAGDERGAIEDFGLALRYRPEFVQAWVNRGFVRRGLKDLDGALADYEEALRLDPSLSIARYNRAMILRDKGDATAALAELDEAVRLEPAYPAALAARGQLRATRGDRAAAIADLEKALELGGPGWKEADGLRKQLDELRKF